MKFAIPEISWHNRDPVLSVDFQPKTDENGPLRLATGGTDSHVLIWYVTTAESGSVDLEVAADLARHQKAVNVVRWAPNGVLLASGDDESIIFLWKLKSEKESVPAQNLEGEEVYKETWIIHKTLRGHMEDVLDLSWSADSLQLASGSVDNKLLIWDVTKGKSSAIISDHKGFVQGVAWDPKGLYIATASSDRTFRTFDAATKKVVSRSSKAALPLPAGHALHGARLRLYHDDTLQTFYRRLQWSPDAALLAVPAGRAEPDKGGGRPLNALYIYTRYSLKTPACILPTGEPALVSRWSPVQYKPRPGKAAFPLPRRMLLAVGTRRALMLYDTHQRTPLLLISNIHYTRLTDLSWSADGNTLVASSTDGFCSVLSFAEGELGERLPPPLPATEPMEVQSDIPPVLTPKEEAKEKQEPKSTKPIIDAFIKFKAPTKSPKKVEPKTPVKMDVLEEVAMPSWSDNSNNDIIRPKVMEVDPEITVIDDSEDFKLVYEESQSSKSEISPKTADPSTTSAELTQKTAEPTVETAKTSPESAKLSPKPAKLSPKPAKLSPKPAKLSPKSTKLSPKPANLTAKSPVKRSKPVSPEQGIESAFFKQAKVTDAKTVPLQVQSPKAPRRVNFVTLSSPKNKKKL